MMARGDRRFLVRTVGGAAYLRLLTLTGIGTVLITRLYLSMTGYPQVGGGTLHIAHVLWGGLLMLAGLVAALLYAGGGARVWTALLGGVGLGLFVDEVGKFVTRDNDYFFRPAAGIIYLVFAGLLVLAWRLRGSADGLASAAQIASNGLVSGLTPDQRQTAVRLLAGRDDEAARAVRQLLDAAPTREHSALLKRLVRRPVAVGKWLADRHWVTGTMVVMLVPMLVVVALVFDSQVLVLATGHHIDPGADKGSIVAGAITRTLSAVIAVVGVIRWRRDRLAAYAAFRAALMVNLLASQVFNFTDSQFRAVAELPFTLAALALVSYRLRAGRTPCPAPARD